MNEIKIAFFDIDGTILDTKQTMTEKMAETLRRLRQNGVLICIATGRPAFLVPAFEDITFDAYLTFNGSYCYTKEHVIYKEPIPQEDVLKIIQNAKNMSRPVAIASIHKMMANGADKDLTDYYALAKQKVEIDEAFEMFSKEEIFQIMMGCRKTEYSAVLHGVKGAKITAWWESSVDIIPVGNGKANGIRHILEYFHINSNEAIAFGDGGNDIDMLKAVGTGVAMGNAAEQVKAAADHVCGTVSEDGIYHYCLEHGLI